MQASYCKSYPNSQPNSPLPLLPKRRLFDTWTQPPQKFASSSNEDSSSSSSPPVETKVRNPITANTSRPSSPCLLPSLSLSGSTLSPSDFQYRSMGPNGKRYPFVDAEDPSQTPIPLPGSRSVGQEESLRALGRLQNERWPQLLDVSKQLQKALGVRNEDTFDTPLPLMPFGPPKIGIGNAVAFNPALKHLRSSADGPWMWERSVGVERKSEMMKGAEAPGKAKGKDYGVGMNMPHQEPKEKLGLRESLLMHARQPYGRSTRTELRSLTFHDVTPDMRTGDFKNDLITHFEADSGGQTRLVCFEVNVPAPQPQPQPRPDSKLPGVRKPLSQVPLTERWISFLISTPLVTLVDSEKTAKNPTAGLPPNLSNPPPTSWLIFAAPLKNVTDYLPSKDSVTIRSADGCEKIHQIKRFDYDFSWNGVPIFEFGKKATMLGPLGTQLEGFIKRPFLQAKNLKNYDLDDDEECPTSPEKLGDVNININKRKAATAKELQKRIEKEKVRLEELGEHIWMESRWWHETTEAFYQDTHVWAQVKEAMARGCCRVVVRVDEPSADTQRYQALEKAKGVKNSSLALAAVTGATFETRGGRELDDGSGGVEV